MLDTRAFCIFLVARVIAAVFAPIQDCDEVFNYWEPTHYLSHGYGLQTWEYSPEYAIRSWAYVGLHALSTLLARPVGTKVLEFYMLRVVLALMCSASEAKLFSVISKTLNPRVAVMFMIVSISCTGMFHASIAYLPSSFSMYTTMLGMAAFMNWRGEIRTAEGIFWMGLGGVLGWPFAMAMVIPYMIEELIIAWALQDFKALFWRLTDGVVRVLVVLVGLPYLSHQEPLLRATRLSRAASMASFTGSLSVSRSTFYGTMSSVLAKDQTYMGQNRGTFTFVI